MVILFERTERGEVVAAGAEGSTVKRRTRGFDPSRDLAKQKPVVVPMKDHLLQKQTVQPQSATAAQSAPTVAPMMTSLVSAFAVGKVELSAARATEGRLSSGGGVGGGDGGGGDGSMRGRGG